jgi:hypothetical protein
VTAVRRIAFALLTALVLVAGAATGGAEATPSTPNGLRAFLLRADEPSDTSFPRTPSFAWKPFPGAASYEFQLSTSNAFRENGILWQCPSATCPGLDSPVASPGLSLPWITGSPHGLYGRVRAVMPDQSKTGWSASLGVDVEPPAPPTPVASRPGLLRWTPVPGADGYQVWLIDAGNKVETVNTNVLDERDFYTFHQSSQWIGTVRWRVRAMRGDWKKEERVNGVPVTPYGAWSPVYKSTNSSPPAGPIKLGSTLSDVVTNGSSNDDAHRLMPGFTWTGNESLDGTRAELYRVYVFTDKRCINRVFTGSPVGSPSYAPRPYGGLSLPLSSASLTQARSVYLPDLPDRTKEVLNLTSDGEKLAPNESLKAATPTTGLPVTGGTTGAGAPTQSFSFMTLDPTADLGAPVSLWDDDWPKGGYYWTVVPVTIASPGGASTTIAAASPKGSTTITVASASGFVAGDQVQVGAGSNTEILTISAVGGGAITFSSVTLNAHVGGESVVRLGASAAYQDLEQPQDACAAGRVARFGVNSEPTLVTGDDPFASGLSPSGRLTSAVRTAAFYKSPLVAWTPSLGATAYQVQWSKQAKPFEPVASETTKTPGILTGATSYVLPLTPGTWYYRVRGFDWSLPNGAQSMGWSDVAKIVITKPTFKIVASSTK